MKIHSLSDFRQDMEFGKRMPFSCLFLLHSKRPIR
jgi:hypothetical protein